MRQGRRPAIRWRGSRVRRSAAPPRAAAVVRAGRRAPAPRAHRCALSKIGITGRPRGPARGRGRPRGAPGIVIPATVPRRAAINRSCQRDSGGAAAPPYRRRSLVLASERYFGYRTSFFLKRPETQYLSRPRHNSWPTGRHQAHELSNCRTAAPNAHLTTGRMVSRNPTRSGQIGIKPPILQHGARTSPRSPAPHAESSSAARL